jgi:hypothetical protein
VEQPRDPHAPGRQERREAADLLMTGFAQPPLRVDARAQGIAVANQIESHDGMAPVPVGLDAGI